MKRGNDLSFKKFCQRIRQETTKWRVITDRFVIEGVACHFLHLTRILFHIFRTHNKTSCEQLWRTPVKHSGRVELGRFKIVQRRFQDAHPRFWNVRKLCKYRWMKRADECWTGRPFQNFIKESTIDPNSFI